MRRRAPEVTRTLTFAALASVPLTGIAASITGLHAHPWAVPLTLAPGAVLAALALWRHTRG